MPILKNFFTSNLRISSSILHIFPNFLFLFFKIYKQFFLIIFKFRPNQIRQISIKCTEFVKPAGVSQKSLTASTVRPFPLVRSHSFSLSAHSSVALQWPTSLLTRLRRRRLRETPPARCSGRGGRHSSTGSCRSPGWSSRKAR
jgi:hypothetical protein